MLSQAKSANGNQPLCDMPTNFNEVKSDKYTFSLVLRNTRHRFELDYAYRPTE